MLMRGVPTLRFALAEPPSARYALELAVQARHTDPEPFRSQFCVAALIGNRLQDDLDLEIPQVLFQCLPWLGGRRYGAG